jgi:hypothetical protein
VGVEPGLNLFCRALVTLYLFYYHFLMYLSSSGHILAQLALEANCNY